MTKGHDDVARDGDLSPMDEAAVAMHEMYESLRRAGFTRGEATSIIAKTAAESIVQQAGEQKDTDDGR